MVTKGFLGETPLQESQNLVLSSSVMDLICKLDPKDPIITFELKEGRNTISSLKIMPDIHLDSMLILSVDKFLKENRMDKSLLNNVKVKGRVNLSSSSHKIVMAFVNALNSQT